MAIFDDEIELLQQDDKYDEITVKGNDIEFTADQMAALEREYPFLKDDPETSDEYIKMLENAQEIGLLDDLKEYHM